MTAIDGFSGRANPGSVPETGGSVTYTYQVTNTSPDGSTDPLSSVTLTDTDGTPTFTGGDTNNNALLDFGEIWTYTLTVPVHEGTAHDAVAAVSATGLATTSVTARRPTLDDVYLRLTGDSLAA